MTEDYRNLGKQVLGTVFKKPSNIDVIEKYIFHGTKNINDYNNLLYECMSYFNMNRDASSIRLILKDISRNRVLWSNTTYEPYLIKKQEEDQFNSQPFEIEEGVMECGKCGSKRTISFQKQTRSADEGATTFAQCVDCGNKWKHNN